MKTKVLADFQICISVPLIKIVGAVHNQKLCQLTVSKQKVDLYLQWYVFQWFDHGTIIRTIIRLSCSSMVWLSVSVFEIVQLTVAVKFLSLQPCVRKYLSLKTANNSMKSIH